MSMFSDYECGAMDEFEYREACKSMNRRDRYEREHMYDEFDDDEFDEEDDEHDKQ